MPPDDNKNGRVLGLITARGGSKGVPGKNIKLLAGKPLINWTIDAAQASGCFDRLVLSTDSAEIADVAKAAGCEVPFMRPAALARDDAASNDVVLHALEAIHSDHDVVVLLQPTSPLRTAEDIIGCLDLMAAKQAEFVVSVTHADPPPAHIFRQSTSGRLSPLLETVTAKRRQDLAPYYALNGAIYAFKRDWFLQIGWLDIKQAFAFIMPPERSVDIDTAIDFELAELRAKSLRIEKNDRRGNH